MPFLDADVDRLVGLIDRASPALLDALTKDPGASSLLDRIRHDAHVLRRTPSASGTFAHRAARALAASVFGRGQYPVTAAHRAAVESLERRLQTGGLRVFKRQVEGLRAWASLRRAIAGRERDLADALRLAGDAATAEARQRLEAHPATPTVDSLVDWTAYEKATRDALVAAYPDASMAGRRNALLVLRAVRGPGPVRKQDDDEDEPAGGGEVPPPGAPGAPGRPGGGEPPSPLGVVLPDFGLRRLEDEEWARQHAGELVTRIVGTSRRRAQEIIQDLVQRSLREGTPVRELADDLERRLKTISSARADMIARTEMQFAANRGTQDQYRREGVQRQEWSTALDELVCPICEALDGEVVGMDESFSDGSDGPPEHPNCRCTVLPVVE